MYRNLFTEYGYDKLEIEKRLQNIWQDIFVNSETGVYHEVGEDMGFVTDTGNNDVRTEGQSYAMMMAVQFDKKEVFDRVWKWTKTYMYLDSGIHKGYFAWSVGLDGTKNYDGPAPDGEEFFASALFFAANRWGNGEGIFNYEQQAKEILHHCLHNPQPMWDKSNKLIRFVPGLDFSDPSYHVPFFYDCFAERANEEDRQFWKEAAQASRAYWKVACHPVTGLSAEYAHYDGSPELTKGHPNFYSDSYRTALNIALDSQWHGYDTELTACIDRLQKFFCETVKDERDYIYKVDGTKIDEKVLHPVGLIATNAAASLAATDGPNARRCVELFWNTPIRTGERRYYDNFLYGFSFMALSGNYRKY